MTFGVSTAPQAMRNLVDMIRQSPDLAALALDSVIVKDMGDLTGSDAQAVITIGMLNPDEDTHAEAVNTPVDLSGDTQREKYTIHCGLAAVSGDEGDPAGVRDTAFALLAVVARVMVTDQTLRRAVMQSRVAGWTLRIDQTSGGPRAQMNFGIEVDAFTGH
jgi:hypothetical protein